MSNYIPERGDVIWLDFEPKKGNEVGKLRPTLVLSAKKYQELTGLLICCPISSKIQNRTDEVILNTLPRESVIISSIVQTLSWKKRKIEFINTVSEDTLKEVLARLLPLIGGELFSA